MPIINNIAIFFFWTCQSLWYKERVLAKKFELIWLYKSYRNYCWKVFLPVCPSCLAVLSNRWHIYVSSGQWDICRLLSSSMPASARRCPWRHWMARGFIVAGTKIPGVVVEIDTISMHGLSLQLSVSQQLWQQSLQNAEWIKFFWKLKIVWKFHRVGHKTNNFVFFFKVNTI